MNGHSGGPALGSRCYDSCEKFCRVWGKKVIPHVFKVTQQLPWRGHLPDPSLSTHLRFMARLWHTSTVFSHNSALPFLPGWGRRKKSEKEKVNKINLLNTFWGSGKYTGPLWNPRTLYKKNQEDEVCWWATGNCVPSPLCTDCLSGWFLHEPHRSPGSQKNSLLLLVERI